MKKLLLVMVFCVGVSHISVHAKNETSWWSNKWLWGTIGLSVTSALIWATWNWYLKKPKSSNNQNIITTKRDIITIEGLSLEEPTEIKDGFVLLSSTVKIINLSTTLKNALEYASKNTNKILDSSQVIFFLVQTSHKEAVKCIFDLLDHVSSGGYFQTRLSSFLFRINRLPTDSLIDMINCINYLDITIGSEKNNQSELLYTAIIDLLMQKILEDKGKKTAPITPEEAKMVFTFMEEHGLKKEILSKYGQMRSFRMPRLNWNRTNIEGRIAAVAPDASKMIVVSKKVSTWDIKDKKKSCEFVPAARTDMRDPRPFSDPENEIKGVVWTNNTDCYFIMFQEKNPHEKYRMKCSYVARCHVPHAAFDHYSSNWFPVVNADGTIVVVLGYFDELENPLRTLFVDDRKQKITRENKGDRYIQATSVVSFVAPKMTSDDKLFIIPQKHKEKGTGLSIYNRQDKTQHLIETPKLNDKSILLLSGNNKFVAIADRNLKSQDIVIVDIEDKIIKYTLKAASLYAYDQDVFWSHNSSFIVTCDANYKNIVKIWYIQELKDLISTSLGAIESASEKGSVQHTTDITTIALSADDMILVTGSKDQTAKVWDVKEGKLLHTLTGHDAAVTKVLIDESKSFIVTVSNNVVRLWDVLTGDIFNTFVLPYSIKNAWMARDGKHIVVEGTKINEIVILSVPLLLLSAK